MLSNGWHVTTCAVPSCSSNLCWPSPRSALILAPKWKTLLAGAALSVVVASAPPWGMTLIRQKGRRQENTSCTQTSLRPTPVISINNFYHLSKLADYVTNEAMYCFHVPPKASSFHSQVQNVHSRIIFEEKCIGDIARIGIIIFHLRAKESHVLRTVEWNTSGETAGDIWYWSLLGMTGLTKYHSVSIPFA